VVYGDLLFGLGVPIPIRSWSNVKLLGSLMLPVIVQCPFKWFYPTGEKQNLNTPKFGKYFAAADIIAGDYPYIKRYMPTDMRGKIVLTNTTTAEDVKELTERGVTRLITTTPVIDGRSFGTNVMEAVLVTLLGRPADKITPEDYLKKLKELGWAPQVQELNSTAAQAAARAAVPTS
jgi:hypothetical protein